MERKYKDLERRRKRKDTDGEKIIKNGEARMRKRNEKNDRKREGERIKDRPKENKQ